MSHDETVVPRKSTDLGRLRVAYADPPYIGQAKRHYGDHPDYAGEVDHEALIARLERDYPDGWALSASAPSLREILPMCPPDARVLTWVKTFAAYKRNVRVAYAWEPVIVRVCRRLPGSVPTRDFTFSEDVEVITEPITMKRGLSGAKPERVCFWLFNVLGLRPGDDLDDLFPGSGAVTAAWAKWCDLGGPKLKQSVRVTNEIEEAA